jgi:hypothetical protein
MVEDREEVMDLEPDEVTVEDLELLDVLVSVGDEEEVLDPITDRLGREVALTVRL